MTNHLQMWSPHRGPNLLVQVFREAVSGRNRRLYWIMGLFGIFLGSVISVVVVRFVVGGVQLALIAEPADPATAVFLGREPGRIAVANTTTEKPMNVKPCKRKGEEDECRFSVRKKVDERDAAGGTRTVLFDNETGKEVTSDRILVSDDFTRWIINGSKKSKVCQWSLGSCVPSYEH
jgi:hypothetical protein